MYHDDYISEGYALSENLEAMIEPDDEDIEVRWESQRAWMGRAYKAAKAAKVGSTVKCAACGKKFVKHSYQQVFCSNKGPRNCKDRYWNSMVPSRSLRAQLFNK